MWILGIETSGRAGSIALLHDSDVVAEVAPAAEGRRHAQTLVMDVAGMLRQQALKARDIAGVAVSVGPGSFTGLRVGVVFAKTWAWGTGCRLVAVDTLQAVAEQTPQGIDRVFVVSDAQRDDVYVGQYQRVGNELEFRREGAISILVAEAFLAGLAAGDVISGPGADKIPALANYGAKVLSSAQRIPQAATIARIGRREYAREKFAEPKMLEPFYLRRAAAEEKRLGRAETGESGTKEV